MPELDGRLRLLCQDMIEDVPNRHHEDVTRGRFHDSFGQFPLFRMVWAPLTKQPFRKRKQAAVALGFRRAVV
jgi:hypothetical protein